MISGQLPPDLDPDARVPQDYWHPNQDDEDADEWRALAAHQTIREREPWRRNLEVFDELEDG